MKTEILLQLIEHMNNIILALNQNKSEEVIKACMALGEFFQKEFPGKQLEELQKHVKETRDDFKEEKMSSLELFRALSEAKIRSYENVAEQGNREDILAMDALSKGVAVFLFLLGEKVTSTLDSSDLSPDKIYSMMNLIHYSLPSIIKNRPMAAYTVNVMKKNCTECETHLRKIISEEAVKIPLPLSYYNEEKIDVDKVTDNFNAVIEHSSKNNTVISLELRMAVESYQATKRLHAALLTDESDFKKLENVRDEYFKMETRNALESNPDSAVKQFFKKLGYYLANFFTCGLVRLLTEDSPILSPQQQLNKRLNEAIEDVSKVNIFRNAKR